MRKIDLESLAFFKSVVDTGSVTQAAKQLHRVQSNVTTRIRNLEERLEVKLFVRQGNRLSLSPEGERLRGYAERLLRLSAEAESAMQAGIPRGSLKLGTLESTAAARLPPLLSMFHECYPDVLIELVTGSTNRLLEMVQRFEIDAAFISEPFHAPELHTQPAFDEELVLIAARSTPQVLSLAHLRQCTVIAFPAGCSYRRVLEAWLASTGVAPHRILELGSYHAIVACVAAGTGIGIMPRSILKAVHAEPQIQVLPLPVRYAQVCTHLVWQPQYESVATQAMRALLARWKDGVGTSSVSC